MILYNILLLGLCVVKQKKIKDIFFLLKMCVRRGMHFFLTLCTGLTF